MTRTDAFMKSIREFEDSREGWKSDLRLDLARMILMGLDEEEWTQQKLADESGKYPPMISKLVHASNDCRLSTVIDVLYALGIKPALVPVAHNSVPTSYKMTD